jgi:hypothetical protein
VSFDSACLQCWIRSSINQPSMQPKALILIVADFS